MMRVWHRREIGFLAACVFSICLGNAHSDEISLALRIVPPYVMQDSSGAVTGIEYEIIRNALSAQGHSVKVAIYPLSRVIASVTAGTVMAGAPVQSGHNTGRYLSDVYIRYDNIALSLSYRNLGLKSVPELSNYRVVAFQRATTVLGVEFASVMRECDAYTELPDQTTQIRMLFLGRADVAIGDSRIFRTIIHNPETGVDASVQLDEFRLFPETEYRVGFVSAYYRDEFNKGLAKIRANGAYDSIMEKYRIK